MRAVINAPFTVSFAFLTDETPLTASGNVTVTITDQTGATVQTGTATHTGNNYTFSASPVTSPVVLTATASGTFSGNTLSQVLTVDVVSARAFTYAEARGADKAFTNTTTYPTAELEAKRITVEDEFQRIAYRAPFVRAGSKYVDGIRGAELYLRVNDIQTLQSVYTTGNSTIAFDGNIIGDTGTTPVLYTGTLTVSPLGLLTRVDGSSWPVGSQNVQVTYLYGMTSIPEDLKAAMLLRFRSLLLKSNSGIPDRATSFQAAEGGNYTLATPGRGGSVTGIPDVDVVYLEYGLKPPGVF